MYIGTYESFLAKMSTTSRTKTSQQKVANSNFRLDVTRNVKNGLRIYNVSSDFISKQPSVSIKRDTPFLQNRAGIYVCACILVVRALYPHPFALS